MKFLYDRRIIFLVGILTLSGCEKPALERTESNTGWRDKDNRWKRHTIDASSEGADGVKLGDVNGDDLLDIVTGWEEGGMVRIYLNSGPAKVTDIWPAIEVGNVEHVEDAVFLDVDQDGRTDVVSSTEGSTKTMFAHIAPSTPQPYREASLWKTEAFPLTIDKMRWMFAIPMDVDGKAGKDLIAAGKDEGAEIGWLEAPEQNNALKQWRWHSLSPVTWVMSILPYDLNRDGRTDLIYTDRKQEVRGIYWFEKTDGNPDGYFKDRSYLGGRDYELMFMAIGDIAEDQKEEILVATAERQLLYLIRGKDNDWDEKTIGFPDNTGHGKGVAIGDLDGDGINEIVVTNEGASGKVGVFYLDREHGHKNWQAYDISGLAGTKFDRIELLDLDQDGDLDVLTCEEREGLGVIWYENPLL